MCGLTPTEDGSSFNGEDFNVFVAYVAHKDVGGVMQPVVPRIKWRDGACQVERCIATDFKYILFLVQSVPFLVQNVPVLVQIRPFGVQSRAFGVQSRPFGTACQLCAGGSSIFGGRPGDLECV